MSETKLLRLINNAAEKLSQAGIDAGVAESEIILCHLLDCDRLELYLNGPVKISEEVERRFEEILAKRLTRYPLQYILGESYFYGRKFKVDERVMVPTPETELLCENAVRFLQYAGIESPRCLDVGCGSGVIAITVALEYPQCDMTAVDISEGALEVARANAGALGAESIRFAQSDLFTGVADGETFTLILSNPPYIADGEYDALPPEVKADPRIALTSGADGLDTIVPMIEQAPQYLSEGGRVMFEIGYDQRDKVRGIVDADPRYTSIVIMTDLNDIDRLVILGCD